MGNLFRLKVALAFFEFRIRFKCCFNFTKKSR